MIVHEYEVYDINIDGWCRAPHKGTEEQIRFAKGRVIPGTGEDVEPSLADGDGRYNPKHAG